MNVRIDSTMPTNVLSAMIKAIMSKRILSMSSKFSLPKIRSIDRCCLSNQSAVVLCIHSAQVMHRIMEMCAPHEAKGCLNNPLGKLF